MGREEIEYAGAPFRLYKDCGVNGAYVEVPTDPFVSFASMHDEGCNWFYVEHSNWYH